jgi:Flp pilus assembly protein TadD
LEIVTRKESYLQEIESWNGKLEDLGAISAYHLGQYQAAEEYARTALTHHPQDVRLANNLKIILEKGSIKK